MGESFLTSIKTAGNDSHHKDSSLFSQREFSPDHALSANDNGEGCWF
jgi:hypothetical protein